MLQPMQMMGKEIQWIHKVPYIKHDMMLQYMQIMGSMDT